MAQPLKTQALKTQAHKSKAARSVVKLVIGAALLSSISGCDVFGHKVDDGIWFPILLVVGFVLFVILRLRQKGSGRKGWDKPDSNNTGWLDDDGGHLSDSNLDGGDSGDDGGDHGAGH